MNVGWAWAFAPAWFRWTVGLVVAALVAALAGLIEAVVSDDAPKCVRYENCREEVDPSREQAPFEPRTHRVCDCVEVGTGNVLTVERR
jgi:hypothetical protein